METAECLVAILRKDGRLLFMNSFAKEICGADTVALAGDASFVRLIPEPARSRFASDVLTVPGGGSLRGLEAPLSCADGRIRWILWNTSRLPEYGGQPAILMVGLDVTERRKAQERALQTERLAAIGQMVTGLAHESRNALQRSQACLEMLMLEVEDRPEASRLVQRIQRAQGHLHHLYEEVRGYAAPISLRRESCDLLEIIQGTWSHLEVSHKGKLVRLTTDIQASETSCSADRYALEQVFRNILENGIAACPEAGEIRVSIEDALIEGAPAIRVRVEDTGPGLSPEQSERIFEPFFTTKTAGTGLGMAIAKRIIDAHSGQIAVGRSQPGAEIIVTLPHR